MLISRINRTKLLFSLILMSLLFGTMPACAEDALTDISHGAAETYLAVHDLRDVSSPKSVDQVLHQLTLENAIPARFWAASILALQPRPLKVYAHKSALVIVQDIVSLHDTQYREEGIYVLLPWSSRGGFKLGADPDADGFQFFMNTFNTSGANAHNLYMSPVVRFQRIRDKSIVDGAWRKIEHSGFSFALPESFKKSDNAAAFYLGLSPCSKHSYFFPEQPSHCSFKQPGLQEKNFLSEKYYAEGITVSIYYGAHADDFSGWPAIPNSVMANSMAGWPRSAEGRSPLSTAIHM